MLTTVGRAVSSSTRIAGNLEEAKAIKEFYSQIDEALAIRDEVVASLEESEEIVPGVRIGKKAVVGFYYENYRVTETLGARRSTLTLAGHWGPRFTAVTEGKKTTFDFYDGDPDHDSLGDRMNERLRVVEEKQGGGKEAHYTVISGNGGIRSFERDAIEADLEAYQKGWESKVFDALAAAEESALKQAAEVDEGETDLTRKIILTESPLATDGHLRVAWNDAGHTIDIAFEAKEDSENEATEQLFIRKSGDQTVYEYTSENATLGNRISAFGRDLPEDAVNFKVIKEERPGQEPSIIFEEGGFEAPQSWYERATSYLPRMKKVRFKIVD